MRETKIGSEIKDMAHEVMRFGERCVQAGRDWLHDRREDMANRYDEGRRNYASGRRSGQEWEQEDSRYGRSAQSHDDELTYRSGYDPGRTQGQSRSNYSRSRGEFYGSSQAEQRGRSGTGSDWEYEGGPERFAGSEYGENTMRGQGYGGERTSGTYGYGSGSDQYEGRQGYGAQRGSHGSEYDTYGRSRAYGEGSGYSRPQREYGVGQRGMRSQYGEERTGIGSRGSLYGRDRDYLDEGEMSGYRSRESGSQQNPYTGTSRFGTTSGMSASGTSASGMYGNEGYRTDYRSNRGLGPKNYVRSDARITEDINERLTDDDDLDASDISVRVVEGKVTLEGIVDQRWMKHRAEDIADACSGVKEVDNRIQVTTSSSDYGRSTDQGVGRKTGARSTVAGAGTTTGNEPGGTTPSSGTGTPH